MGDAGTGNAGAGATGALLDSVGGGGEPAFKHPCELSARVPGTFDVGTDASDGRCIDREGRFGNVGAGTIIGWLGTGGGRIGPVLVYCKELPPLLYDMIGVCGCAGGAHRNCGGVVGIVGFGTTILRTGA